MNWSLSDPLNYLVAFTFLLIGAMNLYGIIRFVHKMWAAGEDKKIAPLDLLPFSMSILLVVIGLSILFEGTVIGVCLLLASIPLALSVVWFWGVLTSRSRH